MLPVVYWLILLSVSKQLYPAVVPVQVKRTLSLIPSKEMVLVLLQLSEILSCVSCIRVNSKVQFAYPKQLSCPKEQVPYSAVLFSSKRQVTVSVMLVSVGGLMHAPS